MKLSRTTPHELDALIATAIKELENCDPETPEYGKILDRLGKLIELRHLDRGDRKHTRVSADQMAGIAANLIAILAIMSFEKTNVITTKAFGMVPKIHT